MAKKQVIQESDHMWLVHFKDGQESSYDELYQGFYSLTKEQCERNDRPDLSLEVFCEIVALFKLKAQNFDYRLYAPIQSYVYSYGRFLLIEKHGIDEKDYVDFHKYLRVAQTDLNQLDQSFIAGLKAKWQNTEQESIDWRKDKTNSVSFRNADWWSRFKWLFIIGTAVLMLAFIVSWIFLPGRLQKLKENMGAGEIEVEE